MLQNNPAAGTTGDDSTMKTKTKTIKEKKRDAAEYLKERKLYAARRRFWILFLGGR